MKSKKRIKSENKIKKKETNKLASRKFMNVHDTKNDSVKKYGLKIKKGKCYLCGKNNITGYNHMVNAGYNSNSFGNNKIIYLVPGCASCNGKKQEFLIKKNKIIFKTKRKAEFIPSFYLLQ